MGQFMIRRMFYALITLFILSLTIFTVVRLTGDPVTLMAEPGAQDADLALVRAEWGSTGRCRYNTPPSSGTS